MRLLGFEVTRAKAAPPSALSGVSGRGGWWPIVSEPFTGAWQRNIEIRADLVMAFFAVYACITLIAADIGKLRLKLVEQDENGIWKETTSSAFSPVLRKPNRYQTRQQFVQQWIVSKLSHGNAYILKQRDNRGVVTALYVLDPNRVKPMVAPDGDVYYQLQGDDLSQLPEGLPAVPASEIIHDRMVCLFHPLVGVSPIYACGLAATHGLKIQHNGTQFFDNMSRPSGILTAPAQISDTTAARLKEHWETNYKQGSIGKIAVLGDGLKYEPMTITAVDSQLVEQLRLSAEQVCSAFHVPPYMIGVGPAPTYNNIEALNQQYYAQCLQSLIEAIEVLLDEGLNLENVAERTLGTEFELDDLLRMDTATQVESLNKAVGGGWMAPNEARARRNMKPVVGGASPMMQQQVFSLLALHERDQDKPFAKPPAATPAAAANAEPSNDDAGELDEDEIKRVSAAFLQRMLSDSKVITTEMHA